MDCKKRIKLLQDELVKLQLDVAVIYDRENLIYFAGVDDLEGGCLIVPAEDDPKLICMVLDGEHMRRTSGILDVIPYNFPTVNISVLVAETLGKMGYQNPRIGFTRYFITLKDYQMLRQYHPDMVVGDIAEACYRIRAVKDEGELEKIAKAASFVAVGMKAAFAAAKPGMRENDVLAEADYAMKKAGSQGASFRMQVLTPPRQMLMHPYASDEVIRDDESVVIHLGASYQGYTAKMCRTCFLGNAPEESLRIYETLQQAQKVAIEHLRPGVTSAEVFEAVEAFVREQGYGKWFLIDHIGYGVGIRQSEFYPILGKGIPHRLEANMVVDVLLPTLYVPRNGGPRITDTVLIGENGCKNLTDHQG